MSAAIRINICLLPPEQVAGEVIRASAEFAAYAPLFLLGKEEHVPHVTVYQSDVPHDALPAIVEAVARLTHEASGLELFAKEYRQSGAGYVDVAYHDRPPLHDFQKHVIESVNPLRGGLAAFADIVHEFEQPRQENTDRYGYPEVGPFYIPHLTLTRLKEALKQPLAISVPLDSLSFIPRYLAISRTGPHGISEKILHSFPLKKKAGKA